MCLCFCFASLCNCCLALHSSNCLHWLLYGNVFVVVVFTWRQHCADCSQHLRVAVNVALLQLQRAKSQIRCPTHCCVAVAVVIEKRSSRSQKWRQQYSRQQRHKLHWHLCLKYCPSAILHSLSLFHLIALKAALDYVIVLLAKLGQQLL